MQGVARICWMQYKKFQMKHLRPPEADLVERIDATAMLAQVEAWCAINTGTGNLNGLARQTEHLADAFAALPGTVTLHSPSPITAIGADGMEAEVENGAHLTVSVRPQAPVRLLLTGHMDTVFAPDHPFQSIRWLDPEALNAPGAADMKGGLAIMLAALTAFEQSPAASRIGYDLLINSDEETGSLSSAALIAELAAGKRAALTFEPALLPDGTLAGERRGSGNYSVAVTGRAAHAGRNPQDGRNAVLAAADLALRIKALETPALTVNPSRIDGGGPGNVVPDKAVLRFNIRTGTSADAAHFASALDGLCRMIEREHEVSLRIHGGMSRPPRPLTPEAVHLFELVRQCGAALGQDIGWQRSGGVCDGNNIAACGVPVVDTMGARGGAIHSPDEYLIVPSLRERAALCALVLNRLAGEVS